MLQYRLGTGAMVKGIHTLCMMGSGDREWTFR